MITGNGFGKVFWGLILKYFDYQYKDLISYFLGNRKSLNTSGKEDTCYDCSPLKFIINLLSLDLVDKDLSSYVASHVLSCLE